MKTVKRIFAVFLLFLTVTVVGYLVFTGSRLSAEIGGIYDAQASI